jgi:hypothetical protein
MRCTAYNQARATKGKPTMILARTLKGKGVSFAEDKEGWQGLQERRGAGQGARRLGHRLIKDAGPRGPSMPEKKGSVPI